MPPKTATWVSRFWDVRHLEAVICSAKGMVIRLGMLSRFTHEAFWEATSQAQYEERQGIQFERRRGGYPQSGLPDTPQVGFQSAEPGVNEGCRAQ
jgi:hypothetical protein